MHFYYRKKKVKNIVHLGLTCISWRISFFSVECSVLFLLPAKSVTDQDIKQLLRILVKALESFNDLVLLEALVMCLTRLQPLLRPVSKPIILNYGCRTSLSPTTRQGQIAGLNSYFSRSYIISKCLEPAQLVETVSASTSFFIISNTFWEITFLTFL